MPPILLDGGMGTALWQRSARRSLPCLLNTEEPELVFSLHREFRSAGAQILLSNTFCAHAQALPKDGPSPEEVVTAGRAAGALRFPSRRRRPCRSGSYPL